MFNKMERKEILNANPEGIQYVCATVQTQNSLKKGGCGLNSYVRSSAIRTHGFRGGGVSTADNIFFQHGNKFKDGYFIILFLRMYSYSMWES